MGKGQWELEIDQRAQLRSSKLELALVALQYLPAIIFGWPSAIVGGLLLFVGIFRLSSKLSITGAVISAGFCFYIFASPPPLRWIGLLSFAGNILSIVAVRKKVPTVAAVFIAPFVLVTVYLAIVVFGR